MAPTRRTAAAAALRSVSPRHRLLTTQEAAAVARVSPSCIRQWTHRGHLVPAARQGRTNLYREDHVLEAERTRRNQRSPAVISGRETGSSPTPHTPARQAPQ
ncbi:helix-turn-helix domain-containing protein [Streptoverticillium reticulum]|uniref:helix-turn-helix domain-containing protein n=1 Tax=Streptoverticillium reticulum TaxID=1433415 RepID=UPI0039BFA5A7